MIYGNELFHVDSLKLKEKILKRYSLSLMAEKEVVKWDSLNLDYDAWVSVESVHQSKELKKLQMTVTLKRKVLRSVIEIISPPGMLVMVSWVNYISLPESFHRKDSSKLPFYFQISFLLPVEPIPGRLGFLLTIFLCTVNMFNSVAGNSPKSGGNVTAIIQWMLSSLVFIIIAILEYALILGHKKYWNLSTPEDQQKLEKMSKTVDKWMLLISPPIFAVFTAAFLSSYC